MDRNENKRLFVELLRDNFNKILSELQLVYKLNHNGEKGREAEEILKNFLCGYLPKKYSVTTGFVKSDLGVSNQCDILIYDDTNYAPLYSGYVNKIIHMLSLRGCIECTMRLNKKKVKEDNEKFSSLKSFYRRSDQMKARFTKEPITVLFAYKSEGDTLNHLNDLEEKNIDMVFCADGHLYVLNRKNGKYSDNVVEGIFSGETIHGYTFTKEQHAFSIFYSYLVDNLNVIKSNPEEYRMVQEYSKSSIYVDYKDMY
ncbi:DUF6602 domain-containing protein [Bacillus sp. 3G2]|uniref:DUF6602 domain-containing protein n=1 Tax=Bacillus sp. 3G2 TaxID=3375707 RepID=UPI00378700C3